MIQDITFCYFNRSSNRFFVSVLVARCLARMSHVARYEMLAVKILGDKNTAAKQQYPRLWWHGKTSSAKRNSDRKPKLSARDRCTLKEFVSKITELLQQR